jgi:hypothetical protein
VYRNSKRVQGRGKEDITAFKVHHSGRGDWDWDWEGKRGVGVERSLRHTPRTLCPGERREKKSKCETC